MKYFIVFFSLFFSQVLMALSSVEFREKCLPKDVPGEDFIDSGISWMGQVEKELCKEFFGENSFSVFSLSEYSAEVPKMGAISGYPLLSVVTLPPKSDDDLPVSRITLFKGSEKKEANLDVFHIVKNEDSFRTEDQDEFYLVAARIEDSDDAVFGAILDDGVIDERNVDAMSVFKNEDGFGSVENSKQKYFFSFGETEYNPVVSVEDSDFILPVKNIIEPAGGIGDDSDCNSILEKILRELKT